jgi:hypothetical protein
MEGCDPPIGTGWWPFWHEIGTIDRTIPVKWIERFASERDPIAQLTINSYNDVGGSWSFLTCKRGMMVDPIQSRDHQLQREGRWRTPETSVASHPTISLESSTNGRSR